MEAKFRNKISSSNTLLKEAFKSLFSYYAIIITESDFKSKKKHHPQALTNCKQGTYGATITNFFVAFIILNNRIKSIFSLYIHNYVLLGSMDR